MYNLHGLDGLRKADDFEAAAGHVNALRPRWNRCVSGGIKRHANIRRGDLRVASHDILSMKFFGHENSDATRMP